MIFAGLKPAIFTEDCAHQSSVSTGGKWRLLWLIKICGRERGGLANGVGASTGQLRQTVIPGDRKHDDMLHYVGWNRFRLNR